MKNHQQIKESIILEAINKLQDKNRYISDEYRKVLELQAAGKCATCGKTMKITRYEEREGYFYYKLQCGHGHHNVKIEEGINIREMNTLKVQETGKKWHLKIKMGSEESGDKKFSKGVRKYMKIDRKNNKYDQVITDIETSTVTHEEHMPLNKHRHSKNNKNTCSH